MFILRYAKTHKLHLGLVSFFMFMAYTSLHAADQRKLAWFYYENGASKSLVQFFEPAKITARNKMKELKQSASGHKFIILLNNGFTDLTGKLDETAKLNMPSYSVGQWKTYLASDNALNTGPLSQANFKNSKVDNKDGFASYVYESNYQNYTGFRNLMKSSLDTFLNSKPKDDNTNKSNDSGNTDGDNDEEKPFYKKKWFIVSSIGVVGVSFVGAGAYLVFAKKTDEDRDY